MHPQKQDMRIFNETNEDQTDDKWKIYQSPSGEIFIKNISAPYLQVDDISLKKYEEKQLLGGERLYFNKKDKRFGYVFFCFMNFRSDLKRDRDVEIVDSEKMKKLVKIENDLPKELMCSICTNFLHKCLTLTPCQHSFCSFCLFDHLKLSSQCPLCRAEAISVAKNPILSNLIQLVEDNFSTQQGSQEKKELEEINFGGAIIRNSQGVYIGSYVNEKKDGQGKMIFQDGSIYEGSWKNDKAEGKGTRIYQSGNRYDGFWMNDGRHGVGKYTWISGHEFEGNYEKDVRNGYGTMKYEDGNIYQGDWRNLSGEGKGVMTFTNGDKYDGFWMNDKKHGAGKYIWSSGKEYEGNYENDVRNGYGTMKYEDVKIYQGEWKSGSKEGRGILTLSIGDKYEGSWVNNILQPEVKIEYSNGEKYEGEINVENLQKQGKGILTLHNGNKYIGKWVNDRIQSHVKIEYPSGDIFEGKINVESLSRQGKGVLTFKNGDQYDGNWNNDKEHGKGREISRGGTRVYEGVWKEGRMSGEVMMTDDVNGTKYQAEWKVKDSRSGSGKNKRNK